MDFSHVKIPGEGQLKATLETSKGSIHVELFEDKAPNTVRNFVGLATGQIEWTHPKTGEKSTEPLYENVLFHRVIPNFMIQCGDPIGTGTGGPGYRFRDEFARGLRHEPGTLSMANSGPNTNGSQFFITEVATPHLDGKHAIFGRVTQGMDVVKAIAHAKRDRRDRPVDDIVLQTVHVSRG